MHTERGFYYVCKTGSSLDQVVVVGFFAGGLDLGQLALSFLLLAGLLICPGVPSDEIIELPQLLCESTLPYYHPCLASPSDLHLLSGRSVGPVVAGYTGYALR